MSRETTKQALFLLSNICTDAERMESLPGLDGVERLMVHQILNAVSVLGFRLRDKAMGVRFVSTVEALQAAADEVKAEREGKVVQ